MDNYMNRDTQVNSLIIGAFPVVSDARNALAKLKEVDSNQYVHLIENENPQPEAGIRDEAGHVNPPPSRRGGVSYFLSRLMGVGEEVEPGVSFKAKKSADDIEPELVDAWGLDPEAERIMTEAYNRNQHLLLIGRTQLRDKAVSVIESYGGQILSDDVYLGDRGILDKTSP